MNCSKLAKKLSVLALAGAIAFSVVPASAFAEPTKQEQAAAVKKEIDAIEVELSAAVENYNVANDKYTQILSDKEATQAKIEELQGELDVTKGKLSDRASAMYRQGQFSFLDVLMGAQSFEDFASLWATLNQMNDSDTALVKQVKGLKAEQEKQKEELAKQETAASEQLEIASASKKEIEGKMAERQNKLSGIEAEIAALRAAEEAAAAANTSKSKSSGGGGKNFPPPTNAPRSEVCSIAAKYLGAPYVWAASGPNSFDCSGFTMFVYKQVGVSLPHSSSAQINCGQRVSRDDLQPGDLVFFYSPISHVGIYVGNNQYIHAPTSGQTVCYSSNWSSFSGACRP